MMEKNGSKHHQVANDGCSFGYGPDDRIKTMADNYVVTSPTAANKWGKEYRRYRSGRTRLYMCMVSMMLFISLAMVCTVFLFHNSFYLQPSKYDLKNGDMREVDVSTLFCQSIVVEKANFSRRITVVSEVKRYKASKQSRYSDVVILPRDRYWYRSFYLLKGSIVAMRLSSHHSISVYWLKGRSTLDKWTEEMKKNLEETLQFQTDKFTRTSMRDTFNVASDDNYYLGFASNAGDMKYSEVVVNMSVSRVLYDTGSCKAVCNASAGTSCHVELRFYSDDLAVIEVDDIAINRPTHDVWTVWYCQPRIWVYAALFGGIYLFGNIILLLIYFCVLSKVDKKLPNQQPSVIPSRTASFNTRAVKLQSMNNTGISGDNIAEDSQEWLTMENHIDGDIPEENDTTVVLVRSHNEFESNHYDPQITPPSPPRWSTFLREHPFEEELVTNFSQLTPNASASASSPDLTNSAEEISFANELSEQLRMLEPENVLYVGPEETDLDDPYSDHYYDPDSEFEPFINNEIEDNNEDFSEIEPQNVVKRREGRREPRWEPRLSMVTEV